MRASVGLERKVLTLSLCIYSGKLGDVDDGVVVVVNVICKFVVDAAG